MESDYTYEGRILFSKRRPYPGVPLQNGALLPSKFRPIIIQAAHDGVGHVVASKTMKWILEEFVWPGMRKVIRAHVSKCATWPITEDRCMLICRRLNTPYTHAI